MTRCSFPKSLPHHCMHLMNPSKLAFVYRDATRINEARQKAAQEEQESRALQEAEAMIPSFLGDALKHAEAGKEGCHEIALNAASSKGRRLYALLKDMGYNVHWSLGGDRLSLDFEQPEAEPPQSFSDTSDDLDTDDDLLHSACSNSKPHTGFWKRLGFGNG